MTWKFAFKGDTDDYSVVLQHTLNSGKKVIFLNGNQIYEIEKVRRERRSVSGLPGRAAGGAGGVLEPRRRRADAVSS